MSHLNYNHLYYFWMTQKKGSVTQAAEALFLTPQTVTGQIKLLEQRLGGKLLIRKGRSLEATELGQLVFRYADKMFSLSYEMLDIVNYRKESQILFDVGIADALSKRLASRVLLSVIPNDGSIHLRCFESTHELTPASTPVCFPSGWGGVASVSSARRRCPKSLFPPVWRSASCSFRAGVPPWVDS